MYSFWVGILRNCFFHMKLLVLAISPSLGMNEMANGHPLSTTLKWYMDLMRSKVTWGAAHDYFFWRSQEYLVPFHHLWSAFATGRRFFFTSRWNGEGGKPHLSEEIRQNGSDLGSLAASCSVPVKILAQKHELPCCGPCETMVVGGNTKNMSVFLTFNSIVVLLL